MKPDDKAAKIEEEREDRLHWGRFLFSLAGWGWALIAVIVVLWVAGIGWFLSLSGTLLLLALAGFAVWDMNEDAKVREELDRKEKAERPYGGGW